eukprot:NODE_3180_length_2078_cov_16.924654.p1 GENE.NODE_3180_length_2078_cov_16.924654~~NODE_3180_length_2078_cov_16.924654.p1  ORF type:complete len:594 (-),score=143.58 NODE_3180_length_2078_cov_16.924654:169-1950(-)
MVASRQPLAVLPRLILRPCYHPCLVAGRLAGRRGFAYEDTLAYRLNGPKKLCMVVHPVIPEAGGFKRPSEILWDAEEALGLVRANRWDLVPGPNAEPRGGWDYEALEHAQKTEAYRSRSIQALSPEGWHYDRGEDESDDEYDVHEPLWQSSIVKQQWAETCIVKLRYIEPSMLFGKGKVQEMALHVARNPCDYVFVNTTLTPTQSRNLEAIFCNALVAGDTARRREEERVVRPKTPPEIQVIDRNRLILEIFLLRANTPQAKLQVGLAQLDYLKTRMVLGSRGRLEMTLRLLREQVGPFHRVTGFKNGLDVQHHYQAEPFQTERALLRIAEARLKRSAEKDARTRRLHQQNRRDIPTIGIVGYTNAGKTTLMNRMTGAQLRERDLLFETLDTTMRRVQLPTGGHGIIADSIGFIQNLPHHLFAAFEATLAELVNCDVLIHVCDVAHPHRGLQRDTVLETLRSAGVSQEKLENSMIEVWNKIDKLTNEEMRAMVAACPPGVVMVCATEGTGVDDLLVVLDTVVSLQVDRKRRTVAFTEEEMPKALKFLHTHGTVLNETMVVNERGDVRMDVVLTSSALAAWDAHFSKSSGVLSV